MCHSGKIINAQYSVDDWTYTEITKSRNETEWNWIILLGIENLKKLIQLETENKLLEVIQK